MTHFKTLFLAALLSTVAAVSLAKAPAASSKGHSAPASVTAPTGAKAKVNRHKSARPAKNNNKVHHAAKKQKSAQSANHSNSKGPGLEAY